LALLFASLPVASKLLLGFWGFEGAIQLAVLCFLAGVYLHFWARRRAKALSDAAAMLGQALQFAGEGQTDRAIALLSKAIHQNRHFWQAYQYRAKLYLERQDSWTRGLADVETALRLAPNEPDLYALRDHARALLTDKISSQNEPV